MINTVIKNQPNENICHSHSSELPRLAEAESNHNKYVSMCSLQGSYLLSTLERGLIFSNTSKELRALNQYEATTIHICHRHWIEGKDPTSSSRCFITWNSNSPLYPSVTRKNNLIGWIWIILNKMEKKSKICCCTESTNAQQKENHLILTVCNFWHIPKNARITHVLYSWQTGHRMNGSSWIWYLAFKAI